MATAIRPIGHEDKLSVIDHLDELRTRLIICVVALVVIFSLCFWQNGRLLDFIGKPLATQTEKRTKEGKGALGEIYVALEGTRKSLGLQAAGLDAVARDPKTSPATRRALQALAASSRAELAKLPTNPPANRPVTLGIGEPFTQTLSVAFWFALLLALPLILYQAYAFVLPAFTPEERKVALPLMAMVPVLFFAGVAFGYVLVLPAATKFLQNFNSDEFNVLVQARDYYKFAIITLAAVGLCFQLPVGILALTRLGVVSVATLRANRRYAIVVNAVIAMLLPGVDPVSMLIEFAILHALYEMSVLLATLFIRRAPAEPDYPEE